LELSTMNLMELFDNIEGYPCMNMFLSNYEDDIYKLFTFTREKQLITTLNKIYEIVSYRDEHIICRCIIIDDSISLV
jgi:hypothetical protein